MDKPSVYHATVVIFLEFFAWGLLTGPTLHVRGILILSAVFVFCRLLFQMF